MTGSLIITQERGIHIITGEGRGKTSAVMGQVLSAASHGLSVCIIFFMKATHELAEYKVLSSLPRVHWAGFGRAGFLRPAIPERRTGSSPRRPWVMHMMPLNQGSGTL